MTELEQLRAELAEAKEALRMADACLDREAAWHRQTSEQRNALEAHLAEERTASQASGSAFEVALKEARVRARAVAFEEAKNSFRLLRASFPEAVGTDWDSISRELSSLAPLPQSLVVLPRETVEKLRTGVGGMPCDRLTEDQLGSATLPCRRCGLLDLLAEVTR